MRIRKQLNINNTFRVINFNLYNASNKFIESSSLSINDLTKMIKNGTIKDKYIIVRNCRNEDIKKNTKIFNSGAHIYYYTETTVPSYVIFSLGNIKNAEVVYKYRQHFSSEDLQNIKTLFEVLPVAVYLEPELNMSASDYLFSLNDLRYIADKVYYNFNDSFSIEDKMYYFEYSHEVLARWKLQLYLKVKDSEQEQTMLSKLEKYL